MAAGEAIGHLAEAFPHVTVADLEARAGVKQPTGAAGSSSNNGGMTFAAFNLQTILQKGTALLASGGQVRVHVAMHVHGMHAGMHIVPVPCCLFMCPKDLTT